MYWTHDQNWRRAIKQWTTQNSSVLMRVVLFFKFLNHTEKLKIVPKCEINKTVVFLTALLRDCRCLLSSRSPRVQRKDQRWRLCAWRPGRGAHVCPSSSFARWEFRPSAADVRNALFSSLLLGLSINSSLFITIPMTTSSYYRAKVKDCSHYLFIYWIVFRWLVFFFSPSALPSIHPCCSNNVISYGDSRARARILRDQICWIIRNEKENVTRPIISHRKSMGAAL